MQYLILAIIMVIGWVIPAAAQEAAPVEPTIEGVIRAAAEQISKAQAEANAKIENAAKNLAVKNGQTCVTYTVTFKKEVTAYVKYFNFSRTLDVNGKGLRLEKTFDAAENYSVDIVSLVDGGETQIRSKTWYSDKPLLVLQGTKVLFMDEESILVKLRDISNCYL